MFKLLYPEYVIKRTGFIGKLKALKRISKNRKNLNIGLTGFVSILTGREKSVLEEYLLELNSDSEFFSKLEASYISGQPQKKKIMLRRYSLKNTKESPLHS